MNAEIYTALCKYLTEGQLISPALRVAFPLVKFEAQERETYLFASLLQDAPISAVAGGNTFYSGIFQISLVFPQKTQGLVRPLQVAELVVQQFKAGTQVSTASGRIIKVPREPNVSPLVPDSVRPMVPVSIRYELNSAGGQDG